MHAGKTATSCARAPVRQHAKRRAQRSQARAQSNFFDKQGAGGGSGFGGPPNSGPDLSELMGASEGQLDLGGAIDLTPNQGPQQGGDEDSPLNYDPEGAPLLIAVPHARARTAPGDPHAQAAPRSLVEERFRDSCRPSSPGLNAGCACRALQGQHNDAGRPHRAAIPVQGA